MSFLNRLFGRQIEPSKSESSSQQTRTIDGKQHAPKKEEKKWGLVSESAGKKTILARKEVIDEMIKSIKEQHGGKLDLSEETCVVMFAARLAKYSNDEVVLLGKRHDKGKVIVKYLQSGREAVDDPYWDEPCYTIILPSNTIFSFFLRTTSGGIADSFHSFGSSSAESFARALRKMFDTTNAKFLWFEQKDWDAPAIESVDNETLQRNTPAIRNAIQKTLFAQGVPQSELNEVTGNIEVLPNPLTGIVLFAVQYYGELVTENISLTEAKS